MAKPKRSPHPISNNLTDHNHSCTPYYCNINNIIIRIRIILFSIYQFVSLSMVALLFQYIVIIHTTMDTYKQTNNINSTYFSSFYSPSILFNSILFFLICKRCYWEYFVLRMETFWLIGLPFQYLFNSLFIGLCYRTIELSSWVWY